MVEWLRMSPSMHEKIMGQTSGEDKRETWRVNHAFLSFICHQLAGYLNSYIVFTASDNAVYVIKNFML